MMITYVSGDLFTSPADVLVNTVNTVGVMGKGIAKEFKRIFPEMFEIYQDRCERGEIRIGTLMLYRGHNKSVLNFPTKKDWRNPSQLSFIEQGLKTFVESYDQYGIESIAFPQLGCGNGELDWKTQVQPLMDEYLRPLPILVYIHLASPQTDVPEHRDKEWMKSWLNSEPESLPATEAWSDLVLVARQTGTLDHWKSEVISTRAWDQSEGSEIDSSVEAIQFEAHGSRHFYTLEDFVPIWRRLKTIGLLSEEDLTLPSRELAKPLFSLMRRLEYLVPTEYLSVRGGNDESSDFIEGLMLVPRKASEQRRLMFA